VEKRKKAILPIGILAYVCIVSVLEIGCPFRYVFHVPCPVCGFTRAVLSVLRGDIQQAFFYHPLVLFLPIWLMVVFCRDTRAAVKIGKKKVWGFLYTGAGLIFLVYLYRLFNGLIV
jgi:hypothetical protein